MSRRWSAAVLGLLAVAAATGGAAAADRFAVVGATLHPVDGAPIRGGVLLVEGGKILALGAGLEVPAQFQRVEAAGRHLYPAFIQSTSSLGLVEIASVEASNDSTENADLLPELRVEVAWNADSQLLPPTLAEGVGVAHVVPAGPLLAGTSAVMRLCGWSWQDMTIAAPVGMHLRFPQLVAGQGEGFGRPKKQEEIDRERKEQLARLAALFADARAWRAAQAAGKAEEDARLAALAPVLAGELPLFLHARELSQIEAALDFAAAQEIPRLVLVTGADAARIAPRLAREGVPVILDGVLRLPDRRWEPYDQAFTAAARLAAAGVRFSIGDGGSRFGTANSRNLPFHAAMAAAHGLAPDAALRSVTLSAAEILGVADRLGSLAPGKEASFFLADGDALEVTTRVETVWCAGKLVDPATNRQRQLAERYRARPAPAAAERP